MAFRTFTTGEVLTAANVQDYLMEQVVITCTSATRPSSPNEGMTIYETDNDQVLVYDGSTWLPTAKPHDWTTYTPTISNGGTATFTSPTGRWRYIAPKTVLFTCHWTVNAAGSGASNVTFTTPTNIDRGFRWVFVGQAESGGGGLTGVHGVSLQSGTGNVVDRIRYLTATNLVGTDLTSGRIFTFTGTYEED